MAAPIDVRGVASAIFHGNLVERSGGGTGFNVTTDGTNPVAYCYWDRTNIMRGTTTPNLVHASITAFEGREPLSGTPTTAMGAAMGTGGSRSVTGNGDSGVVTATTGSTGVTTGDLVTVTFSRARRTAPLVTLTANGANAAQLKLYATSTTTGFTIGVGDAPAISTQYKITYFVPS